jgi:23S rRNA pseudouridine1911/1915/1917 synthase
MLHLIRVCPFLSFFVSSGSLQDLGCIFSSEKEKLPKKTYLVHSDDIDQRLDIFLSERIKELTRSQLQKLIAGKRARIGEKPRKSSYRLKEGELVSFEYELPGEEEILAEDIPLNIIYEDAHLVIIDKSSGMVVHPGAGRKQKTLVNALLYHYPGIRKIGPKERPGLVHRLDRETSGLLVVAKSNKAYTELKRQFKQRKVRKMYLGLVWGNISQHEGSIRWPIGRHSRHGGRMSIKTKKPRSAETLFKVLKRYGRFTLLEINPVTGRTHQIRVHLAASGHPLVGDMRYGHRKSKIRCPRLFLHASKITIDHPQTGIKVEYSSPLPEDLEAFLHKVQP